MLIGSAFSAALAGVLVNAMLPDIAGAARLLMLTFAAITAIGVVVPRRAARCAPRHG